MLTLALAFAAISQWKLHVYGEQGKSDTEMAAQEDSDLDDIAIRWATRSLEKCAQFAPLQACNRDWPWVRRIAFYRRIADDAPPLIYSSGRAPMTNSEARNLWLAFALALVGYRVIDQIQSDRPNG